MLASADVNEQTIFQTIADDAPVMIWITDPTGYCTYLNKQWLEFTGQTLKEGQGLGWTNAVHPDDREAAGQVFMECSNEQKPFNFDYRIRHKSGEYRWAIDTGKPRFDNEGNFLGFIGTVTDITERKLAEANLQLNEDRLRITIESTELGTWDFYPEHGRLNWDSRCKEMFGLKPDSFVDYAVFLKGLHPEDRERVDAIVQNSLRPESGGFYNTEYRTIGLEDGKLRWVLARGKTFFDESGKAVRFIGTVLDITDKKIAEEALKMQARVLESMDEGVSVSDEEGIIVYTNAAEETMFGYEAGELLGQHVSVQNAYDPEENQRIVSAVIDEIKQHGVWNGEWHNKRKNGTTFYTYSHITLLELGERKVMVCVQRDITEEKKYKEALQRSAEELENRVVERTRELKEANDQLERSNEELEQFAYITSHDLQEPLRKIKTFASRIEDELSGSDQVMAQKYLAKVINSANRMSVLIRDLLNYSKLTREGRNIEPVNLNEIAEEVLSDLEVLVAQKKATINFTNLPVVNGIRLQLSQLFFNLIGNSLKFAHPDVPPVIAIDTYTLTAAESTAVGLPAADYVAIRFKDNGIGFNPSYKEQIFEIFQRLNSRDSFAGTGIGLALSKKVVENHRGRITAESEEGKGAAFTVYLPAD
ncbi:PAS domain S-box protein [Flavisolibacter sp. BT320]|nr:PAS domain S-box protein [Flavisolibacter longurius]